MIRTEARPQPPDAQVHPGMPRWVKGAIAVVLVLVAMLAVSKLAGVEHSSARHGGDQQRPPVQVDGHRSPGGHGAP